MDKTVVCSVYNPGVQDRGKVRENEMPIFVKASPHVPGERDIYGPYDEHNLRNVVTFARISSARAKKRNRREVYWVCGRRKPMLLRTYLNGGRVFPKGKRRTTTSEQFKVLVECLAKATGKCKAGVPKEITSTHLKKHRSLPKRFTCPVGIRNLPKKRFVEDVGNGQMIIPENLLREAVPNTSDSDVKPNIIPPSIPEQSIPKGVDNTDLPFNPYCPDTDEIPK